MESPESKNIRHRLIAVEGILDVAERFGRGGDGGRVDRMFAHVASGSDADRFVREVEQLAVDVQPIPLTSIPLDDRGDPDIGALARQGVADGDAAERARSALAALPGVDDAAVCVSTRTFETPRIHRDDLVPTTEEHRAVPAGAELVLSDRPAEQHGPPIAWGADAPRTLADALRRAAAADQPKAVTVIQPDGNVVSMTYPELLTQARRVAAALSKHGVRAGDAVLLQLERGQYYFPVLWACFLNGWVPAPSTVPPVYESSNSNVRKLIGAWRMLDQPVIVTNRERVPQLEALAGVAGLDAFRVLAVEDLLEAAPVVEQHEAAPDDLALLLFTSGSTGMPKGVQLTHRNLLSMAAGSAQGCGFDSDDVTLSWMPLDHVGSVSFLHVMPVYLGCAQVHAPSDLVLQKPSRWLDWIECYRATVTWGVNFVFGVLNDRFEEFRDGSWDLSSMRFLVNAGEAVVAKVVAQFLENMRPWGLAPTMIPAFGMSETCSGITWSTGYTLEDARREEAHVDLGPPIPGAGLRIVDDEGRVLREGEVGRLHLQGPSVTRGYYRAQEENAKVFTADGWFDTGDLGFLRNGALTLTGREKDVIVVSGINYYCHEIESLVEELEGVEPTFTAACGLQSGANRGDGWALFFVPADSCRDDTGALAAEIRRTVVRRIGIDPDVLVPAKPSQIPKTNIGKIQRAALAGRLADGMFDEAVRELELAMGVANGIPSWFFEPCWIRKNASAQSAGPRARTAVVFAKTPAIPDGLRDAIETYICVEAGTSFERLSPVHFRIDPANSDDYRTLFASLCADGYAVDAVVHLWNCGKLADAPLGAASMQCCLTLGCDSLLHVLNAFRSAYGDAVSLLILWGATESARVLGADPLRPERTTIAGLLKTLEQESPQIRVRLVDLDAAAEWPARWSCVGAELREPARDLESAWRGQHRYVRRLRHVAVTERTPVDDGFVHKGCYALTGGLGGLGQVLARYMVESFDARVLLLGRTPIDAEDNRDLAAALRSLQRLGDVRYAVADVCDALSVEAAVTAAEAAWVAPLDGIVHLAGAYRSCPVMEESIDNVHEMLGAKLQGGITAASVAATRRNCRLIAFSSVNGFFGGSMVGTYAAGNTFLEALTQYLSEIEGRRCDVFAWSQWKDIGISKGYELAELVRRKGFMSIEPSAGLASLTGCLARNAGGLIVGLDPDNLHIRSWRSDVVDTARSLRAFVKVSEQNFERKYLDEVVVEDSQGVPLDVQVEYVSEIPRTDEGVADFGVLLGSRAGRPGGHRSTPPRDELEERIAEIWGEFLQVDEVGIHDSFFDLGGSSLLMAQVNGRLCEALHVELSMTELFQFPTISDLSAHLGKSGDASAATAAKTGSDRGAHRRERLRNARRA